MDILDLTTEEKQLLIDAVFAVTPTGGSSPQWRLMNKLCNQLRMQPNNDQSFALQGIARAEHEEAS